MNTAPAHRHHLNDHDYYDRGIYLVTIVASDYERGQYPRGEGVFGRLGNDVQKPVVELNALGKTVEKEWRQTVADEADKGNKISTIAHVVMPDHLHGILFVEERMNKSVGAVIAAFKARCTQAYRANLTAKLTAKLAAINGGSNTQHGDSDTEPDSTKPDLHHMSQAQRAAYYAEQHAASNHASTPLFEDNYDDTVLYGKNQLQAMIDYVRDNPRRAIMRLLYPYFFSRCQHIRIAGHDYAAFGNLFLLRRPWKESVMCHRWRMIDETRNIRDYSTPYESTDEYQTRYARLTDAASHGCVIVTPGISKGEQIIKNTCLEQGLPLIHLQKEPIGEHWKPEKSRFAACERGTLLILAPYKATLAAKLTAKLAAINGGSITQHGGSDTQPSGSDTEPGGSDTEPGGSDTEQGGVSPVGGDSVYCGNSNVPADSDYSIFHNMNELAKIIAANTESGVIIRNSKQSY